MDRFTAKVNALADELEERTAAGIGAGEGEELRVMVSGSPMAIPNWKLPHLIETAGVRVVYDELCTGERYFQDLVGEPVAGATRDQLVEAIARRSLAIDCACFSPNQTRIDKIVRQAAAFGVDGVIHYALQSCDPYTIEAFRVEKAVREAGIPVLRLETDYSQEDAGQLKTRLEAFFETLAERRERQ